MAVLPLITGSVAESHSPELGDRASGPHAELERVAEGSEENPHSDEDDAVNGFKQGFGQKDQDCQCEEDSEEMHEFVRVVSCSLIWG